MGTGIRQEAESLTRRFGVDALREARSCLESATAARDHKAGIYWADVCTLLSPRVRGTRIPK